MTSPFFSLHTYSIDALMTLEILCSPIHTQLPGCYYFTHKGNDKKRNLFYFYNVIQNGREYDRSEVIYDQTKRLPDGRVQVLVLVLLIFETNFEVASRNEKSATKRIRSVVQTDTPSTSFSSRSLSFGSPECLSCVHLYPT